MYSAKIVFLGTVRFLLKDVGPGVLGMVLRSRVRPAILNRMPAGRIVARDVYDRLKGRPYRLRRLNIREGHVLHEGEMMDLPDVRTPQESTYCVQIHNAEKAGRHFDLRVQLKGKAVSWAIPMKGIRSDIVRFPQPGEKWMAIRQPDHTVPYMKFEGEIPEGLGKGTVTLLADGICDVIKIEDGNVHLRLYGQIKGDYVIVSTTKGAGLIFNKPYIPGEKWSKPRYTKKDIIDALDETNRVAENKVDGASTEVVIGEYGNRAFSHRISKRTGELIEYTDKLPHIRDQKIPEEAGTRLRVETYHPNGVNFVAGLLNSSIERSRLLQAIYGKAKMAVFDATHERGKSIMDKPYSYRREVYTRVANKLGNNVHPVQSASKNFSGFYKKCIFGKRVPSDGIVVKELGTTFNERPIIKVKPSDTIDCTVVDISEGLGKHSGSLGALTCEVPDTHKHIQVGTGFTDYERDWIWKHRHEVVGEIAKVNVHVRHGTVTNTGPRFEDWHPDKSEFALKMYSDVLDVSPYALKSAAGWRAA